MRELCLVYEDWMKQARKAASRRVPRLCLRHAAQLVLPRRESGESIGGLDTLRKSIEIRHDKGNSY